MSKKSVVIAENKWKKNEEMKEIKAIQNVIKISAMTVCLQLKVLAVQNFKSGKSPLVEVP